MICMSWFDQVGFGVSSAMFPSVALQGLLFLRTSKHVVVATMRTGRCVSDSIYLLLSWTLYMLAIQDYRAKSKQQQRDSN